MKRLLLLGILVCIPNSMIAQGWGQIQKIVTTERSIGDQFGWSVAIDGEYAVVGSRGGGPPGVFRGTAYVFQKDGNDVWNEVDQLVNTDNANFDEYGYSIAISGGYIFVGAIGQDYIGNGTGSFSSAAGAVYVYENDGSGNWNEVQKLVASDRETENRFGHIIAIQGNYAAIGVFKQDYDATGSNFLDDAGAVYVFELDDNGNWEEVQKIVPSDRGAFDYFGRYGVSIDGDVLVVGAYSEDEDVAGANTISSAGSAYIFERDGTGTWNEVQKLVASDREQGEWFGKSVAIQGSTIVVGAEQEYETNNTSAQYGAAYIFEEDNNGTWNEVQKIVPSYLQPFSKFGQSVSIDGNHAIVGAYRVDIGSAIGGGAAFMFEKNGSGTWNQIASMYDADANNADYFGYDVAIKGDFAIVGAYQEDEDEAGMMTLGEAGSAYIFDINEPNILEPLETLSTTEDDFANAIMAYPNPTDNEFTIDLNQYYEQIDVSMYNSLGQRVLHHLYYETQSITIKINQPQGPYFIELNSGSTSSIIKIIKK